MSRLSNLMDALFRRDNKNKFVSVDEVQLGQMVEVRFHDPRHLGIQVPGQLTCTRFNPDEFEDRVIKGFLTFKGKWDGGPNYGNYIIVESRKQDQRRDFLFLQQEIDTIRVLN